MSKLMTVKEYAKLRGVSTSAIYNSIRRGTCFTVIRHGVTLVFVEKDKTIRKPRNASKNNSKV